MPSSALTYVPVAAIWPSAILRAAASVVIPCSSADRARTNGRRFSHQIERVEPRNETEEVSCPNVSQK